MHNAPSVDSGDTSTRDDPTLMLRATASGSPPPTLWTSPDTVGRNAGNTTPDVLLYREIAPVTHAITPLSVSGDASRASRSVKSVMPPVVSINVTSVLTPVTIRIAPHGTRAIARPSSAALDPSNTTAARNALNPGWNRNRTTPTIHAARIA